MLNATACLVVDDANKLNQWRSGAQPERLGDLEVARPALMRWRACSTFTPARSSSSRSGREASSCRLKVTDMLSGTCVVR